MFATPVSATNDSDREKNGNDSLQPKVEADLFDYIVKLSTELSATNEAVEMGSLSTSVPSSNDTEWTLQRL
jgi:hypothetical protein